VGERRLARAWARAAAHDRRRRGAVMRGPERRRRHQRPPRLEQAGDRVDPGHLERLDVVERRQDPREAARKHRLPGSRRSGEQEVVRAGRGDLERAPRALVAPHVRKIGLWRWREYAVPVRRVVGRRLALASQESHRLGEVCERNRLDPGQRRLGRGLRGAEDPGEAGRACSLGRGQHPSHRPHASVQRELAERGQACERVVRQLPRGRRQRERDREVEAGALLLQPRRGEVDRDPGARPLELGRPHAAAKPLPRLLARPVGKADDREPRNPVADVHLDLDAARVEADERMCDRPCEHASTLPGNL